MISTICVRRDTVRVPGNAVIKAVILCLCAGVVLSGTLYPATRSFAVEAHPGSAAESLYSEAVLAFNRKQTREAVKILDELLVGNPEHLPALELMALTLKEGGNDLKALEVYEKLLKLKPEQAGAYHFELGVIHQRQKKIPQASEHFKKALEARFNEGAAHLFLGLIAFDAGNMKEAEIHFKEVKRAGNPELKVVGHYYTGMILFKNGNGAIATAEINEARSLAKDLPDSKMARDIRAASDKILAPFQASQTFASLTFLGQYDSNIALVPSGVASAQTSKQSTPNLTLSGGAGKMGSPVGSFQWVGSFRFSANKTLNAQTRTYDFFTITPSLHLTYKPLAQTSGGLKLEGNGAMQRRSENPADPAVPYLYRPYSLGVDVGPFLRHSFSEAWQLQAEVSAKAQQNYSDAELAGKTFSGKFSVRGSTRSLYFNPTFTGIVERNQANGLENRSESFGGGFANNLRLGANDTLNASLDVLASRYPDSVQSRSDLNFVGRFSYIHRFNAKISLLGDLTFVKNSSTEKEIYSYNRMTVGTGVGWSF